MLTKDLYELKATRAHDAEAMTTARLGGVDRQNPMMRTARNHTRLKLTSLISCSLVHICSLLGLDLRLCHAYHLSASSLIHEESS